MRNTTVDAAQAAKTDLLRLLGLALLLLGWRFALLPQLGITLYVDEAQYWTWAQEMDWGFFSKPPGIAALIWLSTACFGDGLLGVKALAMLCYPLSALVCWAIARRLYDAQTAFWSALAIMTLPVFSWLGLFVSTDALLTLFWTLALWAYLRACERDGWADWLLLGLICGLGLLSKYTMAAWMLAAGLHLLVFHRTRLASPRPWVGLAIAVLLLLPNILWNVAHDFPTLRHTADITVNKTAAGGLRQLGEFWAAQWLACGPLLGFFLFALFFRVDRVMRDARTRLLLWFALPLWLIVSAQALKSGANANWAAPAFAPALIAVVAGLLARGQRRWLLAGLVINVVLVAVVYHWSHILATVNVAQAAKKDPYTRARGWDVLGQQLGPLLTAHPEAILVADNRTVLAHMRYELRAQQPSAMSWNPGGEAGDHYKLTTHLDQQRGRDVLFVSRDPIGESITGRFRSATPLGTLRAPLDRQTDGAALTLNVTLLHDFQGY